MEVDVDRTTLVIVVAGCVTVVTEVRVARLVIVIRFPEIVWVAVEVAKEVERMVDVAGLRVVPGRPELVLLTVAHSVGPGKLIVDVFVKDVIVVLTVIVVVPSARASKPLGKRRAPEDGAHVIVVFLVEVSVEVVDCKTVLAFAVVVLTTKAPERETELVLLTPFSVLVT